MFLLYFYFGYIAEVGTGGLGNLTGDMSFLQTNFSLSTYPGRVVRTVTRFVQETGAAYFRSNTCIGSNALRLRRNGAGEYACQLLKAGSAAQPRGCSACFVLAGGVTGIIFVTHKLLTHKHIGYLPRCLLHASNTT